MIISRDLVIFSRNLVIISRDLIIIIKPIRGAHNETQVPFKHMLNWRFSNGCSKKIGVIVWYNRDCFWTEPSLDINRITFMYQYAWKDVWQQCSCVVNERLTGNHGDWLQAPFVKNLAPWPPTNRWTYCCPQMTLFKTTLSYIKWICRFFWYSHFKSVYLTCVWMGLPFTCMHP